jgi:outer membrane protein
MQDPQQQTREISLSEAAALLIQANRLDEAKRVLALALQQNPADYEAVFLRAMIAVAEKDYDAAIEDFRRILVAEPDRERVRLELARAFFLNGDYDNAERNFRFARAGNLPDEVKTNIDQYLAAILRDKHWNYDFGLALANDTNANGATNVKQVDLYGLPFTLSDNARQKSGTGIAIDTGGEYLPLIVGNWKAHLGGRLHRLEYGGSAFDDMTVSAYGGPELLFGLWRFNVLGTGFRRWYGNTPYSDGAGGRVGAAYQVLPRLQLDTNIDVTEVTYRMFPEQDGPVTSGNIEAIYTSSPSSFVRASFGLGAQAAKADALADTTHWLSLDYYRDLPYGFSANLEPAFSWTRYNAPLPAFGVTRADHAWAFRLDVLNRRIEYAGFAPRVSFIYVDQISNVVLYRYSRFQIQLGLTRQF